MSILFLCDSVQEECWMKAERTSKKWLNVSSVLPSVQTTWWRCDREQVCWVVDLLRADSRNVLPSSATGRENDGCRWAATHSLHSSPRCSAHNANCVLFVLYPGDNNNSVNADWPFTDVDIMMMHFQLQKTIKHQNVLFKFKFVSQFSLYGGIFTLFTIKFCF